MKKLQSECGTLSGSGTEGAATRTYRIARIDVHKKMLAVVLADVASEGDYQFERRKFGAGPDQLRQVAAGAPSPPAALFAPLPDCTQPLR